MLKVLGLISLIVMPQAALSQTPTISEKCLIALEASKLDDAKQYAETLLMFKSITSQKTIDEGVECINRALGKDVLYDIVAGGFLEAAEIQEKADKAKAAYQEQQRLEYERRQDQLNAELDQEAAERRLKIARQRAFSVTAGVCFNLFKEDANQAILSPVCSPIFLEIGMPEED
jgi:hypothetical protein